MSTPQHDITQKPQLIMVRQHLRPVVVLFTTGSRTTASIGPSTKGGLDGALYVCEAGCGHFFLLCALHISTPSPLWFLFICVLFSCYFGAFDCVCFVFSCVHFPSSFASLHFFCLFCLCVCFRCPCFFLMWSCKVCLVCVLAVLPPCSLRFPSLPVAP